VTSRSHRHHTSSVYLPSPGPLRLCKSLLFLFPLRFELIRNDQLCYLVRVRCLKPLADLQAAFRLGQVDDITPARSVQHAFLYLSPAGARRNKDNGSFAVYVSVEGKPWLGAINGRCQRARTCRRGRGKLQRLTSHIHAQLHQIVGGTISQLLEGRTHAVLCTNGYPAALGQALTPRAPALQRLRIFDVLKALLLGRQRISTLAVGDMLGPALCRQLVWFSDDERLRKVLAAELPHEGQAGARKQHLLAHGSGIGNVGYGDEGAIGGSQAIGTAQENVECLAGLDVRSERREVGEK